MKNCPYCGEKIQNVAKKCRYCGEFLEKNNGNDRKEFKNFFESIIWRIIKILYFLTSLPCLIFVLLGIISEGYSFQIQPEGYRFNNYFYGVATCIGIIIGYILMTDLLRGIISYVSIGKFKGFINYKSFLKNYVRIVILIIFSIILLIFVGSNYKKNRDDAEIFVGFSETLIDALYKSTGIYTGEEQKEQMYMLYKELKPVVDTYVPFMLDAEWDTVETGNLILSKPKAMGQFDLTHYENGEYSYDYYNEFELYPNKNISVKKTDFTGLVEHCVSTAGWWFDGAILPTNEKGELIDEEGKTQQYYVDSMNKRFKAIIQSIIDGTLDLSGNFSFDIQGCGEVEAPFNYNKITVDGVNGLIIDHNPTQDVACASTLFKEIILVKSMDEIYDIILNYNFGYYFVNELLNSNYSSITNKGNYFYGDICLGDWHENNYNSEDNKIRRYIISNGDENLSTSFGFNYGVIENIINKLHVK